MNINPKSASVLLHKLREGMSAVVAGGDELAGQVEVDGAYFGSRTRLANRVADRRQQRREDRQVVVVARERGLGRTIPWVVSRESEAVPMIRRVVASGTEVHADEASGWDILNASYPMKRVNHSVEFKSEEGGCTNEAESYFSRLRRSEFGIHHRISGHLLQAYANEMAWREDNRRVSNGVQWKWITAAALGNPKSKRWAGYWHRSAR
jgi:transposase-like protein